MQARAPRSPQRHIVLLVAATAVTLSPMAETSTTDLGAVECVHLLSTMNGDDCDRQACLHVAPVVSETFDLGPTRLRVALATDEVTVLEGEIEPGAGSSWHTHTEEDETVVVLDGELVLNDGDRHVLRHGDAYIVPRGRRHAFVNEGDALVRMYFFCSPGGLERFFRDVASGAPLQQAASRAGLILG